MLLREKMLHDLRLARRAEGTIKRYVADVANFAKFHGRSPELLGQDEVRAWVSHLEDRGLSAGRLNQIFSALKFLYCKTLARPEAVSFLVTPKRPKRLPAVLSRQEVERLLGALEHPTHRALFTTIYAGGLRISEACALQVGDIDAARGVIIVRHGKGDKERWVPLSPQLLLFLRKYYRRHRPKGGFLFTGRTGRPLNPESARAALRLAAADAGLRHRRVTPHVLRHSFATHLLDSGTELRVIQTVLGHESIQSTTRYVQVSQETLRKMKSPLDELPRS